MEKECFADRLKEEEQMFFEQAANGTELMFELCNGHERWYQNE